MASEAIRSARRAAFDSDDDYVLNGSWLAGNPA